VHFTTAPLQARREDARASAPAIKPMSTIAIPTYQAVIIGLLSAIGAVLAFGLLPPNRWFGIHTPRTMLEKEAWYRAHRAVGLITLCLALVGVLVNVWPMHPLFQAIFGFFCLIGAAGAYAIAYRKYAV
jgi:hypothetical protein